MSIKLSVGDKILSMINSGLSILVIVTSHVFIPELFNYAIIFAIVLIALTIIGLAIKIAAQTKKINSQTEEIAKLQNDQKSIQEELAQKDEHIALLEQLSNVPIFEKWNLIYTFMWRKAISFLHNPVYLYEVHVTRKLKGPGKLKDNLVTYMFYGECEDKVKSFKFCIAGLGNEPIDTIQFKVLDLSLNQELEYGILRNSSDSDIKYIEIFFKDPKEKGDVFKLELKWRWPKTAYINSDYFSIPNIYSNKTKRIILDLYPTDDMKLSSVDTYKIAIEDTKPIKIDHIYRNKEGYYHSIIDNPVANADYITYYE